MGHAYNHDDDSEEFLHGGWKKVKKVNTNQRALDDGSIFPTTNTTSDVVINAEAESNATINPAIVGGEDVAPGEFEVSGVVVVLTSLSLSHVPFLTKSAYI